METMPLLGSDDARNKDKKWAQNFDDSSSGYESTDTWDIDSISSCDSNDDLDSVCGLEENFARSHDGVNESMKVNCSNSLGDNMKLILAMPDLCDVTFLVGPGEIPVHGLRAVMSVRSRVFQQLIFKHMHMRTVKKDKKTPKSGKRTKEQCGLVCTERLEIPVHKYDAEVFGMLIQFIHSGTAYITAETVTGLLCGAVQFELQELENVCWDFIENCLTTGRAESLLVPTRAYSQHEITKQVFDKIYAVLDQRFISPYQTDTYTRKETSV